MVSMKEIAQAVGVSRTTVSFVLNGKAEEMKISRSMAEKIQRTARRMGYIRNDLVRSVIKGESCSIAVLTMRKNYMLPALFGFIEEAHACNYHVNLIPVHECDINAALTRAVAFRPAGICVMTSDFNYQDIDPVFHRLDIPAIGLGTHSGRMNFDQKMSSSAGTEYLLSLGHKKIFYVAGHSTIGSERQQGYVDTMTARGLECRVAVKEDFDSTDKLLDEIIASKVTAVQCFNDYYAFQLMQCCFRRRMFVPECFSLLGFGNIPAGEWSTPALSTVDEPYHETGILMFKRMRDLIKYGYEQDYGLICGHVIPRETTVSPDR